MRRAATVLLTTALTSGGLAALARPACDHRHQPAEPHDHGHRPRADTGPATSTPISTSPPESTPHHPAPALLATNGFGGDKTDQADLAQGFGEQGYVTLSYTGLGFIDGDNCPITLDDREHDGAAAGQLMRFLGGDPSIAADDDATGEPVHVDQVVREDATTGTPYDPQVGMTGGSYGGQIQFAAAGYEKAAGTNRLDAIVPLITWNDLSYSLAPENSGLPQGTARSGSVTSSGTGVFKYQWASLFTTVGVGDGAADAAALTDPAPRRRTTSHTTARNFEPEVCQALLEVGTLGYPSQAIDRLPPVQLRRHLHGRRPGAHADRPGPGRHPVQPAGVGGDLHRAQAPGHPGLPDLAVVGPQRPDQAARRAGHAAPGPVPPGPRGAGLVRLLRPRPRHRPAAELRATTATGSSRPRTTSPRPTRRRRPTRSARSRPTTCPAPAPRGGRRAGDRRDRSARARAATPTWRRSARTTPRRRALDQTQPVTDPPGSAIRFATPPLAKPMDVVGSARLTVQLSAPSVAAHPGGRARRASWSPSPSSTTSARTARSSCRTG